MRRLLVLLAVLVLGLGLAPAAAASDGDAPKAGLLSRLTDHLVGPVEKQVAKADAASPSADTSARTSETATRRGTPPTGSARIAAVDEPIVAVDDFYTVAQDSGGNALTPDILDNDSPIVQGKPRNVVILSEPAHGVRDGAFPTTYRPNPGFNGTDTFTYRLEERDSENVSNVATVTITVTPTGTPGQRVAGDDAYTVAQDSGTTLTPSPLLNDQPELGLANKTFTVTTPAQRGEVVVTNAPDPDDVTFNYTPYNGYTGTDTFQYRYADSGTGANPSTIATVTITVTPNGEVGGNLVDVVADCSGDVTFTNLVATEITVGYGNYANDMVEGEVHIPAGESTTVTTNRAVVEYVARSQVPLDSEEGFIEIPADCSNGGGGGGEGGGDDDDEDGDGDDHDGKHHHGKHNGHLPDTGSPFASTSLLAAWLLTAAGSYLVLRSRRRII